MPTSLTSLIESGHAARPLLAALETFCDALVEESLKRIDRAVENSSLTGEMALAVAHEIAAYRRILLRLRQRVEAGEHAANKIAAERQQETYA